MKQKAGLFVEGPATRKYTFRKYLRYCGSPFLALSLAGGMVLFGLSAPVAFSQSAAPTQRVIQGKVFAPSGTIQANAVVYLKDQKTLEIKSYISTADGIYRFGQLGSQDDYLLWAEFGGNKSKNKNISAFDSRKMFDISLHIEDK